MRLWIAFLKRTTSFHYMLVTVRLKRKSKPNLEGQWAGAKSFSAFHQYFIWRGIEGQGLKGTKTHIHSGYLRGKKKDTLAQK